MDDSSPIKHPKKQKLYRFLAYSMTLTSVGCQSWWGFTAPNNFLKITSHVLKLSIVYIPVSAILYAYLNYNVTPFETLGHILCVVSMGTVVNIKIFTTYFCSFKQVIKNFFEKYHLFNCLNDNEYNRKILLKVEKISKIIAISMPTATCLDAALWLLVTLIYNIKNRDVVTLNKTIQFQSSFYLLMPFDYLYDFNWMIVYYLLNVIHVTIYACFVSIFEVITYITIFHLIGHIIILKNEIKNIFKDNLPEHEVKARIVEIIKYHNFIIKAFKDVQSAFGLSVSSSYLNNLLTNSLLMYLMIYSEPANSARYGLTMLVFLGGSAVMSFIFEEIRIQCYDLSETLYLVPWEDMSISNQKCILIILAQMQPPLIFIAAGGLIAGIQPLIFIIKTAFSYYIMLKSVL